MFISIWVSVNGYTCKSVTFKAGVDIEIKNSVATCAVRLVLVLQPAHRLMAPSTESRTRTCEAPVHPNRESKLPNPVSHQTHATYAPHPTFCIARTTRPTMVQPPLNPLIVQIPFPRVRTPHTNAAPCAMAHENGTDQPIVGILGLVSSSHTREVTNT
jgi:hypothetical protein